MKLAVMTTSTTLFNLICRCFEDDDAACHRFADDVAFARAIYREEYDVILIDAGTGIDPLLPVLARRDCYADRRAPLLVVGAGHERTNIARLFDAGADDVVLSPVDARELMLRVHLALLRVQLHSADTSNTVECGAYRLDRRTCSVQIDGRMVRLTSREFAIAWLLFSHPGEYVSRRQIAGAVWSSPEDVVGRTLEQHIYKLRKKLELNGAFGVHLRTLYAHGYRIELAGAAGTEVALEAAAEATHEDAGARLEPLRGSARANHASPAIETLEPLACTASPQPPHRAAVHAAESDVARNAPPWRDSQTAFTPRGGWDPALDTRTRRSN